MPYQKQQNSDGTDAVCSADNDVGFYWSSPPAKGPFCRAAVATPLEERHGNFVIVWKAGSGMAASARRLVNKVAFLTGSGSGIGRAIAQKFAQEGAKVVVTDLNEQAASAVANEIRAAGGTAVAMKLDVSAEGMVDRSVADAVAAFGKVDILLNNAGFQHIQRMDQVEYSVWRKMLDVHVNGAFLCTRAVLRDMYARAQRSPVGKVAESTVLFVGSVHSKTVSPLKAPYCTAKHALEGLSRCVALEGAQFGVRSHLICPGFVRTPLVEKQIPEQAKALGLSEEEVIKKVMLKNTVDGEFTTLEDCTETCTWLCSLPTNVYTGQSFILSHGWHME